MTTRRAFLGTLAGNLFAEPFTVDAQLAGKPHRKVLGLTIPPSLLTRADEVIR